MSTRGALSQVSCSASATRRVLRYLLPVLLECRANLLSIAADSPRSLACKFARHTERRGRVRLIARGRRRCNTVGSRRYAFGRDSGSRRCAFTRDSERCGSMLVAEVVRRRHNSPEQSAIAFIVIVRTVGAS